MSNFKTQLEEVTKSLLNSDNELFVWAADTNNDELLHAAAMASVRAALALKDVERLMDDKLDFDMNVEAYSIHPEDIDSLAALANEFDASDDEFLQKQAAVIDQLLINFAQRNLKALAESEEEAELAKLRAEYRAKARDKSYSWPKEEHEKDIKSAESVKLIKDQIKEYRPLEASLSTRYCPDHPGNQVRRVGDCIYQCALDKKLYNYQEGFTTMKGNSVPGGDVTNQTRNLGDRAVEEMHFSTRESKLSSFASEDNKIVK